MYEKSLKDEIELHFVSDGQVLTSRLSAAEKFQFSITLGLAKYYSDAVSDNVKRSIEQKLRKGELPGKAPFGYKNIDLTADKTDIVLDEEKAYIVRKAFELYSTKAYSLSTLCTKIKAEYHISWIPGVLDKMLNNPFYHGVMIVKGNRYPHRYTPIISKELFEKVQQVKEGFNKKPSKYGGRPYCYRGLITCNECGLRVTPEKHKGYVYYHCTQFRGKHGGAWVREEYITEQLENVFKKLQCPPEVIEQVLTTLETVHKDKVQFHQQHFTTLTKQQTDLNNMIQSLYFDKLKGRITEEQYDSYYGNLRSELDDVIGKLNRLQGAEDNYYLTAKYILDLANRAHSLFVSSEVDEKRQLVKLVLSNLRLDGKNLLYDAQKPFDMLLKNDDHLLWRPQGDSNSCFRRERATS